MLPAPFRFGMVKMRIAVAGSTILLLAKKTPCPTKKWSHDDVPTGITRNYRSPFDHFLP
jgi:hypothetical protein